jgi:hypothetical protein
MAWTGTTAPSSINQQSNQSIILMSHLRFFLFVHPPLTCFASHDIKTTRGSPCLIVIKLFVTVASEGWSAESFGVQLTASGGLWRSSCVGSVSRHPVVSQIRTGASFSSCVHLACWTVHSSTRSSDVWTEERMASALPLYFHKRDTDRKSPS